MRAPKRRHPRREERFVPGSPDVLERLSSAVEYILSVEHKDYFTSAGPGKLRSDATPCPRGLDFDVVQQWLRDAVRRGDVSAVLEGDFPKYVWTRIDGRAFEARLSNSGLGQYKGYPLKDHEAPSWLT